MVHVSGDGVEVAKGGESTGDSQIGHTAQSINPNLNNRPIRFQLKPKKLSGLQKNPAFVKRKLDRNLHKNLNRNLNRQRHRAIDQHELGHTPKRRRTPKPNLGHSRPTSGDYSGLHKMLWTPDKPIFRQRNIPPHKMGPSLVVMSIGTQVLSFEAPSSTCTSTLVFFGSTLVFFGTQVFSFGALSSAAHFISCSSLPTFTGLTDFQPARKSKQGKERLIKHCLFTDFKDN